MKSRISQRTPGRGLCGLALAIVLMALVGCQGAAKREVYADYVVPPRVVSDVSSLERMRIETPKVTVSGKYPGKTKELSVLFEESLRDRLDAKISRERFFDVADEIYANDSGLKRIRKIMLDSRHGYDVKPASLGKTASIKTKSDISLVRQEGVDTIATQLFTIPYVTRYGTDQWRTPFAVPNTAAQTVRTVTSKVPYIITRATATLTVTVFDDKGKQVYQRGFTDLKYEKKIGGDAKPGAEPTVIEIVASLFDEPLREVVQDISPHKITRAVKPNPSGDSKAITLIRAAAFSEAYRTLTVVIDTRETELAASTKEARADLAENLASAKTEEEKKLLTDELEAELAAERKDLSPDYENLAIACEAMGQLGEALAYYEQSAQDDPGNATAKESLARVRELSAQADEVKAGPRMDYQEKKNKDH